jgi:hypothetical protein
MTGAVEVDLSQPDPERLEVSIRIGPERFDVWIQASAQLYGDRSDAAVPLGLLAAMHEGTPLVLSRTVSPRLLIGAGTAQAIMTAFTGGALRPVRIVAAPHSHPGSASPGVGVFFSGGVDSFFTTLKHEPTVSHLVFVRGFDIFDADSARAMAALDSARSAADELGKELIDVTTNLRDFTEAFARWGLAHGPGLATIALALQSQVGRMLIPSSGTYADLIPWGSHPLLDPLWSTETLEVVHDGCESSRMAKVESVASSRIALRHLRVCNRQEAAYNCEVCEKCTRTMVSLRLAGALDRCPTFSHQLDLRRVARHVLESEDTRVFARSNLARALELRHYSLAAALALSLRPHPVLAVGRRVARARYVIGGMLGRHRGLRLPARLLDRDCR